MQANSLALSAGRALQKKQTGFVHFCKESEDLKTHDTIPVYENALFALALFKSRLADHVIEGKALIEKILAFECDGNFPVYLHEYPKQSDPYLGLRLLPIFFWLSIDFGHVIGQLKGELRKLNERILNRVKDLNLPEWAHCRVLAMRGEAFTLPGNLDEGLISLQIAEKRGASIQDVIELACEFWHPDLQLYIGPSMRRNQWGSVPEVTLYDLFLSSWQKRFSDRVTQMHPIHLKGALIRPLTFEPFFKEKPTPWIHFDPSEEMPLWIAWDCHTFALAKKHLGVEEGHSSSTVSKEIILHLPEEEEMPISFYLDHHPDHNLLVDGQKASVFRQGQKLEVVSKDIELSLSFSAEDGIYCGHVMRGNRPSQHLCRGDHLFDSFDWRIAIRTVRPGKRPIRVKVQLERGKESPQLPPLHASHCLHTK